VAEDKDDAGDPQRDPTGTYAIVGELVMVASAIDFQLTQIVIEACHLGRSAMIHSVVATLDPSRKVELLKERSKAIPRGKKYRDNLELYCDLAEAVAAQRNIACHSTPVLADGNWTFKPMAAAKLLKSMRQGKDGSPATIRDFLEAIRKGERAFAVGVDLVENFSRLSAKLSEH
jgi:hypothetical protein